MPVLTSTHRAEIAKREKTITSLTRRLTNVVDERNAVADQNAELIVTAANSRDVLKFAVKARDHWHAESVRLRHERDEAIGYHDACAAMVQTLLDENEQLQVELASAIAASVAVATAAVFAVALSGETTILGGGA